MYDNCRKEKTHCPKGLPREPVDCCGSSDPAGAMEGGGGNYTQPGNVYVLGSVECVFYCGEAKPGGKPQVCRKRQIVFSANEF